MTNRSRRPWVGYDVAEGLLPNPADHNARAH
jgi:hypothetical protein